MDLSNSTVAVTGAGGFIGSHLVEHLAGRPGKLLALVHYNSRGETGLLRFLPEEVLKKVEVHFSDILDPVLTSAQLEGVQVVLHLAASVSIPFSYKAPLSFVGTNVTGTTNVLEAARKARVERLVHVSTSEVYGTARKVPMDENHPLAPQSVYAASKVGGEAMARGYLRSYGLPVTIVRPFNTFGPRQSARAIIPTIISQALWRDRIELGSLDTRRDLTFVGDTARGLALAATCEGALGETINLGTGSSIPIGELAERIMKIIGRELEVVQHPERMRPPASEVDILESDPSTAGDILGWEPEFDLDRGLRTAVDFIRNNRDMYRPEIYST